MNYVRKPDWWNLLSKYWKKFRSLIVHEGKSRHQRRSEIWNDRQLAKAKKGQYIAQYNEMRHKAKLKARNRRNRKQTRALHQRERRSAGAY